MPAVLAFFGNLSGWELILVLVIAILIFGRRLPQVAAQGAHQVMKLRRSLQEMWRETGLAEEWRTLQREVDGVRRFDPLRGDPPRRSEPKALPDQQAAVEAAELAARQAPELPWDAPEEGPAAEEARREGATPEVAQPGAAPRQEGGAQGRSPGSSQESASAAEPDPGSSAEPDPGPPEGRVPRS